MSQLEAAKAMVEREVIATQTRNTIIIDDGTNEAGIPGFPYKFRAQGDKILVSVDIFKSGYECKDCKGSGKLITRCPCEATDRPGYKYTQNNLDADMPFARVEINKNVVCEHCGGIPDTKYKEEECKLCKGTGASLFIPDNSKVLPTTGVIVSVGRDTLRKQQIRRFVFRYLPRFLKNQFNYLIDNELKSQTRVLFGAYTGVMIPTKAPGVVFKVLRDIEVLCIIKGGEDMAAFDFVNIDKDI